MSYTLSSASRAAYRGGVDTSTAYAGYEISPKLSRVVRYAFTAPAQGVSALSFSAANVARAYQYNSFSGIRFAVTTSDASYRNAVEAGGFAGHAAPVAGNGSSYTVSGSCEVSIAPGAEFYLWFFPAEYAHCLWSFANIGTFTVTCEAGAAAFASVDSTVETQGTLRASVGTATAAMTHRLTLCDGAAALLTSEPFTGSVSLTVPRSIFAAYPAKFDFSAAPGASAASVAVNGAALSPPDYEYLSPVLNSASTEFDIVLTDTRGRRANLRRSVTAQSYAPPSLTAVTAQRCDSSGAADENGQYVKVSASVVYSSLGGENTVSLSAAWRYRGGSYGAETALTPAAVKRLSAVLDPDKTLELRFTVTDGLAQSALRTVILAGRRWAMKLRPDGMGVGFGMSPQEGNALELPDGWRVLIGGRSAAEQAWPVGAVFWTSAAENPASLLGFGTWSRANSALPAAWKRET